ncbi:HIT domain-containing protein, partial [Escherichia coli]|nr:HIT domain-containing protein [Escherichia coli]
LIINEMRDFMTDCLFCAIKEEQIPARKIYEDDTVFAIMDISQVTPGHTLVIEGATYKLPASTRLYS